MFIFGSRQKAEGTHNETKETLSSGRNLRDIYHFGLFALPEGTELYQGKCSGIVGSHAHAGPFIFIMDVIISLAGRPDVV